jgi:hypothetical protein
MSKIKQYIETSVENAVEMVGIDEDNLEEVITMECQ